ncbi:hypothetical protein I314_00287 [Cryptococcus bacillisporus CA1873]|uniref:Uncharacterized protein n=1 Tax=Cryptococcus bacillisporus CA1873 TaxID=1296111 RepID=A0ABR5BJ29_CRYGA|nr:hypothetical protein I314_00287 [Cryptococcus bacillisporus CA1873]|eukprot:KIR69183.1 hypothetical protein I314_00287 [Cryptococcus gattii CA1873]
MAMLELNRGPALNAGETYPRDSTERTMNIQLGKPVRPCQRSPPSNLDGCSLSPRSRVLPDSRSRLLPSTAPRKRLRKLPRARLLLTPHSPTCLSHSGSMPSGAPSPPPLGPFGVGQIHLEFPGLGERETETLTERDPSQAISSIRARKGISNIIEVPADLPPAEQQAIDKTHAD